MARKHGARYPWKKWFANPVFTLNQGEHFMGRADTMAQQVRNAASPARYNKRVSIKISPDGKVIKVFVGEKAEERRRGER